MVVALTTILEEVMVEVTVEYGECEYPMTKEALEFFLANPVKWEKSNGQLFTEQVFHQRIGGFRLELKEHDA